MALNWNEWEALSTKEGLMIFYHLKNIIESINSSIDFDILIKYNNIKCDTTKKDKFKSPFYFRKGTKSQLEEQTESDWVNDEDHKVFKSQQPVYHRLDDISSFSEIFIRIKKDSNLEKYGIINNRILIDNFNFIQLRDQSFLEAVVNETISLYGGGNICYELNKQSKNGYDLINIAGKQFLSQIGDFYNGCIDPDEMTYSFNAGLENQLDNISALKYEKAESNGQILFTSEKNIINEAMDLILDKPIHITEFKKVRKLLEITDNNTILVVIGELVTGFIMESKLSQLICTNGFCLFVEIKGSLKWQINLYRFDSQGYVSNVLIEKANGMFLYTKEPICVNDFAEAIKFIFDNDADTSKLWEIISLSKKEQKGTMIVISKQADSEANRLSDCSFKLEKSTFLSNDLIKKITSIDGAALFDEFGKCHAVGVILDGEHLNGKGEDISNGARHNSAIKYFNSNIGKCVIVIVSEDKTIKLLPDLKIIHHLRTSIE